MSIEKHLRSADSLRLHDLNLQTPDRPRPRIDFSQYITPEVLDEMKEEFRTEDREDVPTLAGFGADIALLDPAHRLRLTPEDTLLFNSELDKCRPENQGESLLDLASSIKRIDPSYDVQVTEDDFSRFMEIAEGYRAKEEWENFLYIAACIKTLDPSRALSYTDEEFKKMERAMQTIRPNRMRELCEIARVLAKFRLVAGPSYHLPITDQALQELEQYLAKFLKDYGNSGPSADLAVSIKLIAAHTVTIAGPGKIEVVMEPPKTHTANVAPRPERKV